MGLCNPLKTIMHYLLIGEMTFLSYQDDFSMVSTLVRMVKT